MEGGSRLLLTVDESLGCLAAVRALRAAGHEPVVGTWRPDTYAARSRAVAGHVALPDPQLEPEAHGRALVGAAERERFAAVLPGTESTMRALADHPIELPRGTVLGLESADALARATDKRLLHRLAREAGLDVLPQVAGDGATLLDGDLELDFPVIVKPQRSVESASGGRFDVVQARTAHTPEGLRAAVAQAPERTWLVEPLVEGMLEAVCGVSWHGEVVCAVHQESPRIWPPGQGISTFACTVRPDLERESRIRALVAGLGWSGVFGLQFLRVGGKSYAIDFNPRVYGSIALAVAAGRNLPAIWVELLLGQRPTVGPYRVGVSYRVTVNDLRAVAAGMRRTGRRRQALTALLPRRGTVHGAFEVRDPKPVLAGSYRVVRGARERVGWLLRGLHSRGTLVSGGDSSAPKRPGTATSPHAEWVVDPERFAALAAPWEALVAGWGTPFDRYPWFAAWWEAFAARRQLSVCALWEGEELVAVLPLCRRGRQLQAMANVHTPLFRPLARDPAALRVLLAEVFRGARGGIVIRAVPADDPSFEALREAAALNRWTWLDEASHTSPIVEIEGEYEAYRQRMRSRWSSAERKARKMRREHHASFDLVSAPNDLDAQLRRGFTLEASGWKGRAGTAIDSSQDTSIFYRSVAAAFHRSGELRLSEISLDDRTVAFDLYLLGGGHLYLLKTAYDESYGALSPGLVLQQEVVQTCFRLGLEAYELLGDDSDWKRRFATASRAHRDVRSYPRTPAEVTRFVYRRVARPRLRDAYHRLREMRSAG